MFSLSSPLSPSPLRYSSAADKEALTLSYTNLSELYEKTKEIYLTQVLLAVEHTNSASLSELLASNAQEQLEFISRLCSTFYLGHSHWRSVAPQLYVCESFTPADAQIVTSCTSSRERLGNAPEDTLAAALIRVSIVLVQWLRTQLKLGHWELAQKALSECFFPYQEIAPSRPQNYCYLTQDTPSVIAKALALEIYYRLAGDYYTCVPSQGDAAIQTRDKIAQLVLDNTTYTLSCKNFIRSIFCLGVAPSTSGAYNLHYNFRHYLQFLKNSQILLTSDKEQQLLSNLNLAHHLVPAPEAVQTLSLLLSELQPSPQTIVWLQLQIKEKTYFSLIKEELSVMLDRYTLVHKIKETKDIEAVCRSIGKNKL